MSAAERRRPVWLQPVARVLAVGVLAAAVIIGTDRLGAAPSASPTPSSPERVAATTSTGYCPGDPFAGAEDVDTEVRVSGAAAVHAAPAEALEGLVTPSEQPGRVGLSALSRVPDRATEEKPTSGPPSESRTDLTEPVRSQATQEHAPGAVAMQSVVAGGEQASGIAAVPCTAPTADAWLVAGGGEKGRQERLVLVNPGGNAVTARLEVLGAKGEETDESVVVPARGRSVVLLDGIGRTDTPQAVHVTSSGGLVVPTIVDHHLDGLTPAGVDTVTPTAQPGTRRVIPANPNGDERGVVIGVPGEGDAVVEIRSVDQNGSRSATVETVPAGSVVDVELPERPGLHSWVLESDVPVVAAAHVTTTGSDGTRDMAWSVATPPFGSLGGVALPTGPEDDVRRYIHLTADDGAARAEVLIQRDGEVSTEEVSLEEGHAGTVAVGDAEAVWIRPSSGSVHAAALLLGSSESRRPRATSLPIHPLRVAVRDVEVVRAR